MTFTVDEIYRYVKTKVEDEGELFGLESGSFAAAPSQYLFDSPQGYWTVPDKDFPKQHSWHLFDQIRDLVASATHSVDIVTMDEPTIYLYGAVRAGLVVLAQRQEPVVVRILVGNSLKLGTIDPEAMLKQLRDDFAPYPKRKLQIALAHYRYESASWGHSKFIAVDGKHLFQGGHNLWGHDYMHEEPVFDLSMRYDGPIAWGAHRFANAMWGFVKRHNTGNGHTKSFTMDHTGEIRRGSFGNFRIDASPRGPVPMLWVTNPGWGIFLDGTKPVVDNSFVPAFEKAMEGGSWCRLSQQDLAATWRDSDRDFAILNRNRSGLKDYPYDLIACQHCYFILPLIDAMAKFLLKPGDNWIELVASPEGKAGRGYTNKIPPSAVFNVLGYRMSVLSKPKLTKQQIFDKIKRQFYFGVISFSDKRQTWPPDKNPKYNHAKFWMVDDVFYVGSENFYPSTAPRLPPGLLQEFGVVAQAPPEVKTALLDRYFTPLRTHSVANEPKLSHFTWNEAGAVDGEGAVAAAD